MAFALYSYKKRGEAAGVFTKKEIRALLWPLILEQVLTGLMGVADTFMVSAVGEASISGVALVDSLNMLVMYFFSALAAGGTIVCSQYIGQGDRDRARLAANQVMAASLALSAACCAGLALFRRPVLRLIFGTVEPAVMDAAQVYLLVTALSYPFLALYTASAALHRAAGNSRRPMIVAAAADILNIAGNAVLIFALHMGVLGAALATLASRAVSAAWLLVCQARPGQPFSLGPTEQFLPDRAMLRRILRVGLPSAVENGMFQFGKLVVQSTVSVLGTTAIASQAIIAVLDSCCGTPGQAIGIGLLTVAGQCMGRGRPDEAKKYMVWFTKISTVIVLISGGVISAGAPLITRLTALSPAGRELTCRITWFVSAMRVLFWPAAFTLPNGLRAAGDVSFTMWTGTVSMWTLRVGLSWYLCRYTGVGLWGIWFGWCADWVFRAVCFLLRTRSGRWSRFNVLE